MIGSLPARVDGWCASFVALLLCSASAESGVARSDRARVIVEPAVAPPRELIALALQIPDIALERRIHELSHETRMLELDYAFHRNRHPPEPELELVVPRYDPDLPQWEYVGPLDGDDVMYHIQRVRLVKRLSRPPISPTLY